MIDTNKTLRGSGPAPSGYVRCYDSKCRARKNPCNGQFEAVGTHYHPIVEVPKAPEMISRS